VSFVNAQIKKSNGNHFGKGPNEKYYDPSKRPTKTNARTVGKKRTLPGPG